MDPVCGTALFVNLSGLFLISQPVSRLQASVCGAVFMTHLEEVQQLRVLLHTPGDITKGTM